MRRKAFNNYPHINFSSTFYSFVHIQVSIISFPSTQRTFKNISYSTGMLI